MTNDTVNYWMLIVQIAVLAVQVIGVLGLGIGLFFTNRQLRSNTRQKTAEYSTQLQEQFFTNKDVLKMYYSIEYGEFKYSQDFHGSENEKALDALLYHLDTIANYYLLSHFDLAALGHFAYRYLVVFQDKDVRAYLATLDHWYPNRGLIVEPFSAFRDVGKIIQAKYYTKELDDHSRRESLNPGNTN
jgi:hypothetical protein